MPSFNDLNSFDLALLFLLLVFLIRGVWIGCVRQLASLLALVGGYALAGRYADTVSHWTKQVIDNPKLTFFVSYGIIFLIVVAVCTVIGKILHRFLRLTLLGWLDRLLGLVVGGIKAVVIASLLYMVLASTLSATNDLLRTSRSSPFLQVSAKVLRSWIDDPRLQTSFLQKNPAILSELLPAGQDGQKQGPPKPAP